MEISSYDCQYCCWWNCRINLKVNRLFSFCSVALQLGEGIRSLLNTLVAMNPILAGLITGLLIWPAIIGGIYHAAILPIVILEMERTGNSFLGAVDIVGLVMVSAGITLANIVAPRDKGEAAYPFMFSNKLIFAGAIVSSSIGYLLVGLFDVRGTAYVPSVMAPFLSDNMSGFIIAMVGSIVCAFMITLFVNLVAKKKVKDKDELLSA